MGNPRSEVRPELSGSHEIPELHLRSEMPNTSQKTRPLRFINLDDRNLAGGGMANPPLHRAEELSSEHFGWIDPFLFGQRESGSIPVSRTPEWGVN